MRFLIIFLLLTLPVMAANETYDARYGTGTYYNPFLRTPTYVLDFTVDKTGLPWPTLTWRPPPKNTQRNQDVILTVNSSNTFDPASCPGEIAHCYFKVAHNSSTRVRGANYSFASGYNFPEERIKTFICIDDECTAKATGCYCPEKIPFARQLPTRMTDCPLLGNLCQVTESGALVLCKANYTTCVEQYGKCGCGRYPTCSAGGLQTCINPRDELTLCQGRIGQCIDNFKACFCGTEMLALQAGCTETRHQCMRQEKNVTCIGSFGECAVKYDTCTCGVE